MGIYAVAQDTAHIIDAAKTFAVDKDSCPNTNEDLPGVDTVGATNDDDEVQNTVKSTTKSKITNSGALSLMYEETKTQVPEFFPNDLVEYNENKPFLQINGTRVTWYRPTKLQDLLELKSKFGGKAKLIARTPSWHRDQVQEP